MLSRCLGGLRQAWPCGGSSRVVGFADFAVSDGLGLARWNSLRACSAPFKQPPRVSYEARYARPAPCRHTQPPRKIAPTEPGLPQPTEMVARHRWCANSTLAKTGQPRLWRAVARCREAQVLWPARAARFVLIFAAVVRAERCKRAASSAAWLRHRASKGSPCFAGAASRQAPGPGLARLGLPINHHNTPVSCIQHDAQRSKLT